MRRSRSIYREIIIVTDFLTTSPQKLKYYKGFRYHVFTQNFLFYVKEMNCKLHTQNFLYSRRSSAKSFWTGRKIMIFFASRNPNFYSMNIWIRLTYSRNLLHSTEKFRREEFALTLNNLLWKYGGKDLTRTWSQNWMEVVKFKLLACYVI